MPRVVPSQIVALIDRTPVEWSPVGFEFLTRVQAPELSAIIDLTSELSDELLLLSGDDYSEYRVAVSAVKDLLNLWQSQQSADPSSSQTVKGAKSLRTVRALLAKCPDEAPAPSTVELSFIQDADLRDSLRNDISAANRALHDGLWKAATVLAGAATEALLLWAITNKKASADIQKARAAVIPSASPDPNKWALDGYIKVARALALIEEETVKQADLARDFRNLIHPGRSARLRKACDRQNPSRRFSGARFRCLD
jgi:hypothetical protein